MPSAPRGADAGGRETVQANRSRTQTIGPVWILRSKDFLGTGLLAREEATSGSPATNASRLGKDRDLAEVVGVRSGASDGGGALELFGGLQYRHLNFWNPSNVRSAPE